MNDKFSKSEKQLIEAIAKKSDLIKNFDDVKVFADKETPVLALVDMENRTLYINTKFPLMSFNKILGNIEGIISHENGHLDERLLAPSNLEMSQIYKDFCEKNEIDHGLINLVCDMEIHYQYLTKNKIKPLKRMRLKKFLTDIRNMAFERDKENIALSLTYPITEEQKKVKEIIENRNLDIREKVKRINELEKKNGKGKKPKPQFTGLIIPSLNKDDKKQGDGQNKKGKGKKKGKKPKKQKKKKEKPQMSDKMKNAKSIKAEVEDKGEETEIRNKLSSMGFSDAEINELLEKEDRGDIAEKVENLEQSFKTVLPSIEESYTKERTRERVDSRGHRFNGYHKMRDITEVTENIEDLVTVGQYDLNEIHVPTKIDRKRIGLIVILRDTSGSIGSGDLAKKVRDTTVGLIKMAQKDGHRVGVVDFHSDVEPIKDKRGEVLTREYKKLLLDSMLFKFGYSTRLDKALEYVNEVVKKAKMHETPLNLFIITDGHVSYNEDFKFISKKVNVTGLWCEEDSTNKEPTNIENVNSNFTETIKNFRGKIYEITNNANSLIMYLMRDFNSDNN